MSAEPGRKKAYSSDLRWCIVYQRLAMNLPFEKIAHNLNVAVSTAHRTYRLFEESGSVDPLSLGTRLDCRSLDPHSELYVIGVIMENPSLYLGELCSVIMNAFGIEISASTVCRTLKKYGITRKKIRQMAVQRSNELRGAVMAQCFLLKRDMLVWVDETGSNSCGHVRKYGYALRSVTPASHRFVYRGCRTNAIAAMTNSGIIALELTTSLVNGEMFFDFVRGSLIPNMMPYDGINPRSVVIMDTCSVHHICEVKQLLDEAGILLPYLPPYSPDQDPLEEAFSYVKYYLKRHGDLLQSVTDPTDVIKCAFESITTDHCKGWISHSGYPD